MFHPVKPGRNMQYTTGKAGNNEQKIPAPH